MSSATGSRDRSNDDVVESGDLTALTEQVDHLAHGGDWASLVDLRDRCRGALDRGKQLWPTAAYADYRLALDAPPRLAASVLGASSERFALGPFAEVVASRLSAAEMGDDLPVSPAGFAFVHERVVRGEKLGALVNLDPSLDPFGLPLVRAPWEPDYTVATYEPTRLLAPAPMLPAFGSMLTPVAGRVLTSEAEAERALRDLATVWVAQSNGRAEVVTVEGDASEAVAALGCRRHRLASIDAQLALDWMAWSAASGGAHGRRRGSAAGRLGALWALAHLVGLGDMELGIGDEEIAEMGEALDDLVFFLWDDGSPTTGWSLRLAVQDRDAGIAWALNAFDASLQ